MHYFLELIVYLINLYITTLITYRFYFIFFITSFLYYNKNNIINTKIQSSLHKIIEKKKIIFTVILALFFFKKIIFLKFILILLTLIFFIKNLFILLINFKNDKVIIKELNIYNNINLSLFKLLKFNFIYYYDGLSFLIIHTLLDKINSKANFSFIIERIITTLIGFPLNTLFNIVDWNYIVISSLENINLKEKKNIIQILLYDIKNSTKLYILIKNSTFFNVIKFKKIIIKNGQCWGNSKIDAFLGKWSFYRINTLIFERNNICLEAYGLKPHNIDLIGKKALKDYEKKELILTHTDTTQQVITWKGIKIETLHKYENQNYVRTAYEAQHLIENNLYKLLTQKKMTFGDFLSSKIISEELLIKTARYYIENDWIPILIQSPYKKEIGSFYIIKEKLNNYQRAYLEKLESKENTEFDLFLNEYIKNNYIDDINSFKEGCSSKMGTLNIEQIRNLIIREAITQGGNEGGLIISLFNLI